jgi:hypothetical protein
MLSSGVEVPVSRPRPSRDHWQHLPARGRCQCPPWPESCSPFRQTGPEATRKPVALGAGGSGNAVQRATDYSEIVAQLDEAIGID